mmetsp:Transcript_26759/g.32482  ORF Transcript_26759/g.32482 Transcript_26759/m.32482 type:complete len:155 (-) Transcript_26759:255-719(-)
MNFWNSKLVSEVSTCSWYNRPTGSTTFNTCATIGSRQFELRPNITTFSAYLAKFRGLLNDTTQLIKASQYCTDRNLLIAILLTRMSSTLAVAGIQPLCGHLSRQTWMGLKYQEQCALLELHLLIHIHRRKGLSLSLRLSPAAAECFLLLGEHSG